MMMNPTLFRKYAIEMNHETVVKGVINLINVVSTFNDYQKELKHERDIAIGALRLGELIGQPENPLFSINYSETHGVVINTSGLEAVIQKPAEIAPIVDKIASQIDNKTIQKYR